MTAHLPHTRRAPSGARLLLALPLLLLAVACGDGSDDGGGGGGLLSGGATTGETTLPDATLDDLSEVAAPTLPTAAATPAPPDLPAWSCPTGWTPAPALVDRDGAAEALDGAAVGDLCVPPELPEACEAGTTARLGEAACVQHGVACPEGAPWAEEAVLRERAGGATGEVIYVHADAAPDGDGSRDAPLQRVQDGIRAASPGDVVAVGVGTYPEAIGVQVSIHVVGACSARTRLESPEGGSVTATVNLSRVGSSVVRDMTVSGPRGGVRVLEPRGEVVLEGLRVEDTVGFGVVVDGGAGEVTLRDLIVLDNQPRDRGAGLLLEGGTVTLERGWLARAASAGVLNIGGELTMRQVAVLDSVQENGALGRGVVTVTGATRVTEALIAGNRGAGLEVDQAGGRLEVTDAVVRDTAPSFNPGEGVTLRGGSASLTRTLVEGSHNAGILCLNSALNLKEVTVRHTSPHARDGVRGSGLIVDGCEAEAARLVIHGNASAGVAIAEGRLTVEDLVVSATVFEDAPEPLGRGVSLQERGELIGARVWIDRNITQGVFATGAGTAVTLTDATITGTQLNDGWFGWGITAEDGAALTLERVALTNNHGVGLDLFGGAEARADDLTISDTRPLTETGRHGWGISVEAARFDGARVALSDNSEVGVRLLNGSAAIEDLTVTGNGSYDSSYIDRAVGVNGASDLVLRRALLEGSHTTGVMVSRDGVLTAEDLTVRDSQPKARSAVMGRGIAILAGSVVTLTRVEVERSFESGIMISGPDSEVTLRDARVEGTQLSACAGSCRYIDVEDFAAATGVLVLNGASLDLERFIIADNELVGLQLVNPGPLRLVDGLLRANTIGLNVQQAEQLDLNAAFERVLLAENDLDFDLEAPPVPNSGDAFEALEDLRR